jgi:hypothetical protein
MLSSATAVPTPQAPRVIVESSPAAGDPAGIFLHSGNACAAGRESVKLDGDALRATLKNGLRVVIIPNPLAPVATTVVNYLVGSNDAPRIFRKRPTPRNT